jgi:hypothetical protein
LIFAKGCVLIGAMLPVGSLQPRNDLSVLDMQPGQHLTPVSIAASTLATALSTDLFKTPAWRRCVLDAEVQYIIPLWIALLD